MTDKKLTDVTDNNVGKLNDSEIVRVLELLHKRILKDKFASKVTEGEMLALVEVKDLINRLQAESEQKDKNYIELLKTSGERAVIIGEQGAEIERLKTELDFAKAFRKDTDAEFSLMHRKYGKALDIVRAEVDKIVRCKDCEHYHKGKESTVCDYDYCDILYYCDGSHRTACEEDYCSYGKKRSDKV